jgi:rhodanese-related sulfurtransferase
VVDVRAHDATPIERIPGAVVMGLHAPFDALADHDASSDIVVYCACPHEMSAAVLAERLRTAGYANTWALAGGFDEWKRLQGKLGEHAAVADTTTQQAAAH